MTKRLLTIGRCSQLSGLSIRALRLYDELGLLRPDTVDGQSRYRYYSKEQLPRAALIGRLRRLELPLAEIEQFLTADGGGRVRILRTHQERLQQQLATTAASLRAAEELINNDGELPAAAEVTPMERTTLADQPVMRIRWSLPDDPAEEYPLTAYFDEISRAIEQQGLTATGAPYCLGYDDTDDDLSHGEAGIPVAAAGVAAGRVEPAVLPGGEVGRCRYTGPSGASADAAAVARGLWLQIDAAGLEVRDNPRWIFLGAPDLPPDEHVSELVWSIAS